MCHISAHVHTCSTNEQNFCVHLFISLLHTPYPRSNSVYLSLLTINNSSTPTTGSLGKEKEMSFLGHYSLCIVIFPMAQRAKNPPPMQETQEMLLFDLVFLSGKSQGQRNLAGYNPKGHKELDVTEHKHMHLLSV